MKQKQGARPLYEGRLVNEGWGEDDWEGGWDPVMSPQFVASKSHSPLRSILTGSLLVEIR